jgi:hypothetical protein
MAESMVEMKDNETVVWMVLQLVSIAVDKRVVL